LSNYEIYDLINNQAFTIGNALDDDDYSSLSDLWVIPDIQPESDTIQISNNSGGPSTWVSWLSPDSYTARRNWYDSLHLGGSADWGVDMNTSYAARGLGIRLDDDAEFAGWANVSCKNVTFDTLDDLLKAEDGMPALCVAQATLQTLMTMMDKAYANYTDINNGYDDVFPYYVTYMNKLIPEIIENAFMWNMTTTDAKNNPTKRESTGVISGGGSGSTVQTQLVPDVGFGMLRKCLLRSLLPRLEHLVPSLIVWYLSSLYG
jgi:chitinase